MPLQPSAPGFPLGPGCPGWPCRVNMKLKEITHRVSNQSTYSELLLLSQSLMHGLTGMPLLPENPGTPVIPCGVLRINTLKKRSNKTVMIFDFKTKSRKIFYHISFGTYDTTMTTFTFLPLWSLDAWIA